MRHVIDPSHSTVLQNGTKLSKDEGPESCLMAGRKVVSVLQRPFTETNAQASDLHVAHGHELMEYFLHSGLK